LRAPRGGAIWANMPDHRRHRGAHPRDRELFSEALLPALRSAVEDYSWLLTRGYSASSALALVGDRYQLTARQRVAVSRVACSDAAYAQRLSRRITALELEGEALAVDGFNACITLEVALSGGLVLVGRDGAHRDLASVHGNYRRVTETPRALELLVESLAVLEPARVTWYFDRPVSNSGTLAGLLRRRFEVLGLRWEAELVDYADRHVSGSGLVSISADSGVLDVAERWFDLAGWVIRERLPAAWRIDLTTATVASAAIASARVNADPYSGGGGPANGGADGRLDGSQ
jgi:hypothetical protein